MSARPETKSLHVQDLDLLLSRSLDGDLSPEEERELAEVLEQDPQARRRRDEMASLVTDLKKLPVAEPPFAMGTRVAANALEMARGAGSLWHRFGLYPPPGSALGAVGVLVIVIMSISLLRESKKVDSVASTPVQVAEHRAEEAGPVDVFFGEDDASAKDARAKKEKAHTEVPPAEVASRDAGSKRADAEPDAAERKPAAVLAQAGPARDQLVGKGDGPGAAPPPSSAAQDEKARARRNEDAKVGFSPEAVGERASATRPQPVPAQPAAVDSYSKNGHVTPAAPAIAVERKDSVSKLARKQETAPPGVSLVGSGAASFRIAHAPSLELLSAGLDVTGRVTVDAAGRVVDVRLPPNAPDRVVLERFLKALALERVGQNAASEVDVRVVKP